MPGPTSPNYGRCLQQLCSPSSYQQIWVKIPLVYPFDHRSQTEQPVDGWAVWNQLRHLSGHNKQIYVALEITDDLPHSDQDEAVALSSFRRWCGEPVKAAVLPTSVFLTNQKQFPVLSKRHQLLLKFLMRNKIHLVLKGRPLHCGGTSLVPYFQYLRHLHGTTRSEVASEKTSGELSCDSYNDTLQAPLQPLMDNLESQIYETFERDPVKYATYQTAIAKALCVMKSRLAAMRKREEEGGKSEEEEASPIVVMVVGAGRGPLVAAALSASFETGLAIKIYAVEKNRNAIVTLRNRSRQESWSNVEIIAMDMRRWNPPVKVSSGPPTGASRPSLTLLPQADIMVSELLGSWGDNELSPECLDGAQEYLHPYGVSIPQSYTSYLSPITSSKLWNCACEIFPGDRLKVPPSLLPLPLSSTPLL
jgi:type II protein arginine methyltransferase